MPGLVRILLARLERDCRRSGEFVGSHLAARARFSITYGTAGAFAEVPLRVTYQPRWWMQVELTIDDAADALAAADGVRR